LIKAFENTPSILSRWVKIDPDCYDIKERTLIEWLEQFGTLLTGIEEDNVTVSAFDEDPTSEAGAGQVKLGQGLLSVKMEISKHMPEFVPLNGNRVRFHYGGIPKQCINCYKNGHIKQDCKDEKVSWYTYAERFAYMHDEYLHLFGKWRRILETRKHEQEKANDQAKLLTLVKENTPKQNEDTSSSDTDGTILESEDEITQPVSKLAAIFNQTNQKETGTKPKDSIPPTTNNRDKKPKK